MTEILVAYATKSGSTKEIAEAIAERIRSASHEVTVQDAAQVRSIAAYKAVVVGSPLYVGRWRRDAVKLLQRNADVLARCPVFLFQSGPLDAEPGPRQAPRSVRKIAARIGADEPVTFGGRLTPETAVGFIAKKMARGDMAGDFRDWDQIGRWTDVIAEKLVAVR